jgi:hypothetical protein
MASPYVRAAIAPTLRAAIVIARLASAIPTTLRSAALAVTWWTAPVAMSVNASNARTARAAAPTGGMWHHDRHDAARMTAMMSPVTAAIAVRDAAEAA